MKTLRLTLTKKWFDMILSGEKTEEYREIKDYWRNRLGYFANYYAPGGDYFRHFDEIEFRNGYSKDAQTMLVECKGIRTGIGNPVWGAPSYPVFIIKLGKVIETKNLK